MMMHFGFVFIVMDVGQAEFAKRESGTHIASLSEMELAIERR